MLIRAMVQKFSMHPLGLSKFRGALILCMMIALSGDVVYHAHHLSKLPEGEKIIPLSHDAGAWGLSGRTDIDGILNRLDILIGPIDGPNAHRGPIAILEYEAEPLGFTVLYLMLMLILIGANALYIFSLSNHFVISRPTLAMSKRHYLLVLFLCAGYFAGWLYIKKGINVRSVGIFQTSSFLLLYFMWLITDIRDRISLKSYGYSSDQALYWIILDFFLVLGLFVLLMLQIVQDRESGIVLFGRFYVSQKDLAVVVALLGWGLVEGISKHKHKMKYPTDYGNYLKDTELVKFPKAETLQDLIALAEQKKRPLKILDFGCGNGKRVIEFIEGGLGLKCDDISSTNKVAVNGFDRNPGWENDWMEQKKHCSIFREWVKLPKDFSHYDIIYASHIVYYKKAMKKLLQRFRSSDNDSQRCLVIRGFAYSSFFADVTTAIRKDYSAWWESYLAQKLERYDLKCVRRDIIVQETKVDKTDNAIKEFGSRIGTVVENDLAKEVTPRLVNEWLAQYCGVDSNIRLNNDDIIIYIRNNHERKANVSTP